MSDRPSPIRRGWGRWGVAVLVALQCAASAAAQPGASTPDDDRMRRLQSEMDRLARESRTLLGELRTLELEREMRAQASRRADAELARVTRTLNQTAARVRQLESERLESSRGVHERLVTLYKRRRGGYARLLLERDDLTALGRLSRGVAALARLDRARFDAHRRRLRTERDLLAELETQRGTLVTAQRQARESREALDGAIAAHNRRIDALDAERDLAARYAGELQLARGALDRRVGELPARTAPLAATDAPVTRGSLDWPVAGRVITPFGPGVDARSGASVVRNGLEIASAAGTPVAAVRDGAVAFAAPFTGFGALVIVDHGAGTFTLYGHLADLAVAEGGQVRAGTVVGHSGRTPAGIDALYFELRVDGRPVDPVQWLRSPR